MNRIFGHDADRGSRPKGVEGLEGFLFVKSLESNIYISKHANKSVGSWGLLYLDELSLVEADSQYEDLKEEKLA